MSNDFHIYAFDKFKLDEKEKRLYKNGEKVPLEHQSLSGTIFSCRKCRDFFELNEILDKVWHDAFVEENNVNIQIHKIRKALGQNKNLIFIENEGKSFRFNLPVERSIKEEQTLVKDAPKNVPEIIETYQNPEIIETYQNPEIVETSRNIETQSAEVPKTELESVSFGLRNSLFAISGVIIALILFYLGIVSIGNSDIKDEQLIFIVLNSFAYGLLAAITIILESAYEFDKYGWISARMAPSVLLINAGAMFAGLAKAGELLPDGNSAAFWTGLLFLIIGNAPVCLLGYFVLPNLPITRAKGETQPAFLAFVKNVGFYYLLMYLFFGLFIFCLSNGTSKIYRNILLAAVFLLIWMLLFVVSWTSINVFNSNLKTLKDGDEFRYHSLFVTMSYLRIMFCFLPALLNIAVYFFSIN